MIAGLFLLITRQKPVITSDKLLIARLLYINLFQEDTLRFVAFTIPDNRCICLVFHNYMEKL